MTTTKLPPITIDKPTHKEIHKLRQKGMTYAEIGIKYGVSRQAIHAAFKKIKKCPKCGEIIN
jgi:uncharacterized protein YjcR